MRKPKGKSKHPKTRLRRGDTVVVRKGTEAGKQGKIIRVLRAKGSVLVQGLNYVKKHTKPNPQVGRQGGIMDKEAPIRTANVMLVCVSCEQPTRVSRERLDNGRWARKCMKCGQTFE